MDMDQGSSSRTPCRRLGLSRFGSIKPERSSGSATTKSIPKNTTLHDENLMSFPAMLHGSRALVRDLSPVKVKDLSKKRSFTTEDDCHYSHSRLSPVAKQICSKSRETCPRPTTVQEDEFPKLLGDLETLRRRVTLKEKQVQQLCQTRIYNKKHDPNQLIQLIHQWIQGCQEALQDLQAELNKNGTSIGMSQLLHQLSIPPSLVYFDLETNEFLEEFIL